jgi:hypothetical protein
MKYLVAGLLCIFITSASAVKSQSRCHSSDRYSAILLAKFRSINSPAGAPVRARMSLPVVAPSEIVLVADSATCAQAIAAADSMVTVWNPSNPKEPTTTQFYVMRIGTSYALTDLSPQPNSEFAPVLVFGPGWVYRGMLAM